MLVLGRAVRGETSWMGLEVEIEIEVTVVSVDGLETAGAAGLCGSRAAREGKLRFGISG